MTLGKQLVAGLLLGLVLLVVLIAWQGLTPFTAAFRELGCQGSPWPG